jgi:DNA-binding transcriptional LysR family regulator
MNAFLQLSKLWPWLPHFRVVGEFESLSKAARKFGVTPAALSKGVRHVERMVGAELFDRSSGKMRLNAEGQHFLSVLRAAMRDIDNGIDQAKNQTKSDVVRIAVCNAWSRVLVLPHLSNSTLRVELREPPVALSKALLRGDVDVIVDSNAIVHAEIENWPLGRFEQSLFVSPRHPLVASSGVHAVTLEQVAAQTGIRLVAHQQQIENSELILSMMHRVAIVVANWSALAEAVAANQYIGLLPNAIAAHCQLVQIDIATNTAPIAMYACTRKPRQGPSTPVSVWITQWLSRLSERPDARSIQQ